MIITMIKRYISNFRKYAFKKFYMDEHPDGRSYPPLLKRLDIFWKLKSEPTFEERMQEWENYSLEDKNGH
jgi:hypothetical protein